MNDHHRELSEWGLSKLSVDEPKRILDIGCGGGMFISLLAKRFNSASIFGIDHSQEAVSFAKEFNKDLVGHGRCTISRASVSDLPFEDGEFDLVTAVETYYFWPDLRNDLAEACRVVRKDGTLMILAESYPHPDFDEQNAKYKELYGVNLIPNDEMASILEKNGFDVMSHTIEKNNWVVFIAKKSR